MLNNSRSELSFVTISACYLLSTGRKTKIALRPPNVNTGRHRSESNFKKFRRSALHFSIFLVWFLSKILFVCVRKSAEPPEKISRLADVSVLTPWGRAKQVNIVATKSNDIHTWVVSPPCTLSDCTDITVPNDNFYYAGIWKLLFFVLSKIQHKFDNNCTAYSNAICSLICILNVGL